MAPETDASLSVLRPLGLPARNLNPQPSIFHPLATILKLKQLHTANPSCSSAGCFGHREDCISHHGLVGSPFSGEKATDGMRK